MEKAPRKKIEILGPGCTRCKETYRVVQHVVADGQSTLRRREGRIDRADGRAGPHGDAGCRRSTARSSSTGASRRPTRSGRSWRSREGAGTSLSLPTRVEPPSRVVATSAAPRREALPSGPRCCSAWAPLACWLALYLNLSRMSRWLDVFRCCGLPTGTHFSSAVEFLVFEVPKVLLLLTAVVFAVGIVRSYFTPERTRRILAGTPRVGRHGAGGSARRRHAVLLLLGGPPLPRVRHRGGAARRDVFLPDLGADGQRGGSRAALRALRLEGGGDLHEHGTRHRHGVRLDDRASRRWRISWNPGSDRSGAGATSAERGPSDGGTGSDSGSRRFATSSERSGPTSSPASPSARPSTVGSRPTSWRRSWARTSGGRFRSSS